MVSKTALFVGSGIVAAGAVAVAYYVYARNRSAAQNLANNVYDVDELALKVEESVHAPEIFPPLPCLEDADKMQDYFLKEVQTGEQLLAVGDYFYGIEHLANAVIVCTSPEELLDIFKTSLTPELYNALLHKIPKSRERLVQQIKAQIDDKKPNAVAAI